MTRNTTRRALLGTIPAIAAVPVTVIAAPGNTRAAAADPVHNVIARHRAAWDAHHAAWTHVATMTDQHNPPTLRRAIHASGAIVHRVRGQFDDDPPPVLAALESANEADGALSEATEDLAAARPATVAGVAAMLEHLAHVIDDCDTCFVHHDTLRTVAASLAGALRQIA